MDEKTLTELLNEWSASAPEAPRILDEVRDLARAALAHESPHHTLQPTELVNEVYLRLFDRQTFTWKSRVQFFGLLA
jgi:hypothetical protein